MMGIFSNGFKICRSGSPDTMQSALPERATSKYRSSFGSRHREIFWYGTTHSISLAYRAMISIRISTGLKYLSNFGRNMTSESSSIVSDEANRKWFSSAFRNALAVIPFGLKAALTITLQSTTTRTYSFLSNSFNFSSVIPCFSAWVAENSNRSLSDLDEEITRSTQIFRRTSRLSLLSWSNLSAKSSSNSRLIVFINKFNENSGKRYR